MTDQVCDPLPNAEQKIGALDTTSWIVAIPSYNHADDAILCLDSLWAAKQRPGRVILVDDASTDNAVARIADWARRAGIPVTLIGAEELKTARLLTWLTIVRSAVNSGFAASCNIALRYVRDHTDAPYVLLFNNDAAVSEDYFVELRRGLQKAPNAGLVTGTIFEWDKKTVWYAGGRFNPWRAVSVHERTLPDSDAPRTTAFVCGCSMLISRSALHRLGVFAECYSPAYCEDAEYSLRAVAAGFTLLYVPGAHAYHRVSSSLGRTVRPPSVIYWFNRNRAFALRRNYSGPVKIFGLTYFTVTKAMRAVFEVLRGRPTSGWAFVRATYAGLFDRSACEP